MTALLLAPHCDDETLFAAYTCIREKPHIVTVLTPDDPAERIHESTQAAAILGCTYMPWAFSDSDPDWDRIEGNFVKMAARRRVGYDFDRVYAPWPERGGHEQHNRVGELAREVFGDRVTHYTTYRFGGPRSTGIPVQPEPEWILLKLRALACYRSQILNGPRRFFTHALDEWYAP